jgi:hypothetical protein
MAKAAGSVAAGEADAAAENAGVAVVVAAAVAAAAADFDTAAVMFAKYGQPFRVGAVVATLWLLVASRGRPLFLWQAHAQKRQAHAQKWLGEATTVRASRYLGQHSCQRAVPPGLLLIRWPRSVCAPVVGHFWDRASLLHGEAMIAMLIFCVGDAQKRGRRQLARQP